MYCKCGNKIPDVRIKAGYKTCVECSKEEKWGCSHVIYHKTGNTIEVIKDKELCEQINAMAQRTSFGVCRGMTGNFKKKAIDNPVTRKKRDIRPKLSFNEVGEKTMEIFESNGINEARKFLDECIKNSTISSYQSKKIESILLYLKYENKSN